MFIDKQGYMRFDVYDNDEHIVIKEHKLNTLINNSLYDVFNKDNHVHHKNGCKIDNRPENLEVMSEFEHNSYHKNAFNPCLKIRKYECKLCKQGFRWRAYPYTKDKRIRLSSVDLEICIKKVKDFINSEENILGYTNYEVIGDDGN